VGDLRRQTGGATSGGTTGRHSRLLAIQVAACLMLLTGTGLLLRGARRALVTDPGFDTKRLLMVILAPDAAAPVRPTPWELERGRRIEDGLKAIPGVIAAAGTDRAPFAGHSIGAAVTDEGQWVNGAISLQIGRDYFATLGVRPTAGRGFTPEEALNLAPVVIISQSTARHLWPGREALGRTISWPARTHDGIPVVHYTVVGVVPDVRLTELSKTDRVDLFFPRSATTKWIVRTEGAPEAVIASVYRVLNDIDPTLRSEAAVWTLEQGSLRVQRLFAEIPAAFASLLGAIALSLAGVGVFGVVSFAVARRTREFGVRVALGAQADDVILLVLRQTLPPVVWGTGVGLLGAIILSTLLARFVLSAAVPDFTYGAGAFPVGTFAVASAVLCMLIAVAAWLPARRAAKVDPVMALRTE
jgi:ABC-type antimicrobial peptide transport system permease subunit